jgi:hypothetical protein
MPSKIFKFDFFTFRRANGSTFSLKAKLLNILNNQDCPIWDDVDAKYEIKGVTQSGEFIHGAFCKYRLDNIPHAGSPNNDERELELDTDEGLIEKNYFAFRPNDNLLIFQRNGNASKANKLAKYFTETGTETVSFDPVLKGDSVNRLMRGELKATSLDVSFARPTNPALYPNDEWTRRLMDVLNSAGGARTRIHITSDARSTDQDRNKLQDRIKSAAAAFIGQDGTNVLRLDVLDEDDGGTYPIDLIADRIYTPKQVTMDGRYPVVTSIQRAIRGAFDDMQEELYEVIGQPNNRLT